MSKSENSVRLSSELLTGPISWMARRSVAANLFMIVILMLGLAGALSIKQEVFPDFELDMVTVAVPYPGASPSEVEQGIILAIEEEVRGLNGVKRVSSSASEGAGTVAVELMLGEDNNAILPTSRRRSTASRPSPKTPRSRWCRWPRATRSRESGAVWRSEPASLHELAEQAPPDAGRRPNHPGRAVWRATLEVSIEVSRAQLEALGLSLDDVARQITLAPRAPRGEVESQGGEFLVRVSDRKRRHRSLPTLWYAARPRRAGAPVRHRDDSRCLSRQRSGLLEGSLPCASPRTGGRRDARYRGCGHA